MDAELKDSILSYLKDYKVNLDSDISHYHKLIDDLGGLTDFIVRQLEYLSAKRINCITLIDDVSKDKIGDLREYVRVQSSLFKGSSDFFWDIYQILRFR